MTYTPEFPRDARVVRTNYYILRRGLICVHSNIGTARGERSNEANANSCVTAGLSFDINPPRHRERAT